LIEEGAGIGVLPCFIAYPSDDLQVVCPDQSILRSFWLITHQDTQNLAKVRAGKDWLTACVTNGRDQLLPILNG